MFFIGSEGVLQAGQRFVAVPAARLLRAASVAAAATARVRVGLRHGLGVAHRLRFGWLRSFY